MSLSKTSMLAKLTSLPVFKCLIILLSSIWLTTMVNASSQLDQRVVTVNNQRALLLELTPAVCALYPSRAYTNQCLNNYNLTSEGLDLGYRCTSSTTPVLSPLQQRVLHRIMPDDLYINQAWRHYGACSPYSASNYFRQLSNAANNLNVPLKISAHNSFIMSKDLFIEEMQAVNENMPFDSIHLTCQKSSLSQPILTKMKICYEDSNFAACPPAEDTCGENVIIWGTP